MKFYKEIVTREYKEVDFRNFEAWGKAVVVKNLIIKLKKEEEFEKLVESYHPDGVTEVMLNTLLWSDWVLDELGITDEDFNLYYNQK